MSNEALPGVFTGIPVNDGVLTELQATTPSLTALPREGRTALVLRRLDDACEMYRRTPTVLFRAVLATAAQDARLHVLNETPEPEFLRALAVLIHDAVYLLEG